MKKSLSLLLALVMLISTSSFAITVMAQESITAGSIQKATTNNASMFDNFEFAGSVVTTSWSNMIIEPSVDTVNIGDTVTYNVYLTPSTEIVTGFLVFIDASDGLDIVKNSSVSNPSLDSYKQYWFVNNSNQVVGQYLFVRGKVFSAKTLIGTFKCTVNDKATDSLTVSSSENELDGLIDGHSQVITEFRVIPATVTAPHRIHTLTYHKKVDATCAKTGKKAYYSCNVCGKNFSDSNAVNEIKNLVIPKTDEHENTYFRVLKKASFTNNGIEAEYCRDCGQKLYEESYSGVETPELSTKTYTCDGKAKKPKVYVSYFDGGVIDDYYYNVTYASGRKNVGKYAVKVTLKGDYYTGTKTIYFTIKPKSTTISKVTSGKKAFTVKWKKQSSQTTGYQIQYSTSSKFKSAKTVTVSKNKTTSKKISKLKAKKKYYIRVRTYKTVKVNGKSAKIYSSWSKAKSVTTKK